MAPKTKRVPDPAAPELQSRPSAEPDPRSGETASQDVAPTDEDIRLEALQKTRSTEPPDVDAWRDANRVASSRVWRTSSASSRRCAVPETTTAEGMWCSRTTPSPTMKPMPTRSSARPTTPTPATTPSRLVVPHGGVKLRTASGGRS